MLYIEVMEEKGVSPLKHFVQAKKAITSIFDQLVEYVSDGVTFVEGEFSLRSFNICFGL